MTALLLLLGAGAGAGIWLAVTALVPARPALAEVLARLEYRPSAAPPTAASLEERAGRLVARLGGVAPATGPLAADLAILEMAPSTLAGARLVCATAGLLIGPALAGLASLAGVGVRWAFPAGAAVALGSVGWLVPGLDVRAKAERKRRSFRRSLSGFLDVLTLAMASGELITGALRLAGRSGESWGFRALRAALDDADQRGITPWDALAGLGRRFALSELVEVAASVRLAGTDGARVRRTLEVKAAALRTRALADSEADAAEATTRMVLPLVAIAFGFLVLVGYPAVARIVGGS